MGKCFKILSLVLLLSFLSNDSYGVSTYYYPSPSTISAPTGGATTVCQGTTNAAFSATVTSCGTGTGLFFPNNWTARWYFNGAIVYTSASTTADATVTFTLPAGSFTYTTAGTFSGTGSGSGLYLQISADSGPSPAGCGSVAAGTYVASINSTTIIVNPLPSSVTASLSSSPLCVGSTLTLNGAATGATSYVWTGPAGGAAMTSTTTVSTQVISVNTSNAGIYTLSATNACGTTRATTAALAVNRLPVFTGVTQTPNPACTGGSTRLAATTSTTGIGAAYAWTGPGGTAITNPASLTTASVNPLVAGNAGNYTITATAPGCTGSTTWVSTTPLVVNSAPSAVSASLSANPLCIGSTLTLTGAATGATSYVWSGPAGGAAMTSTTTINTQVTSLTALNAGVYTIAATNTCGTTRATTPALTVNQLPVFTGVTQTPNPACEGASTRLAATTSTTGVGVIYAWTGPGGTAITNPASLTTASVNPLVAGNAGSYTITATAPGCAGSATRVSTSALVVNLLPSVVTASLSSNPACIGSALTLTGAASGATSYVWSGPAGGAAMTSTTTVSTQINSLTALNAGVYTLAATNACGTTRATSTSLTVNQLPVFTGVTQSPNPSCVSGSMVLAATTSTTGIGAVYAWTGPGGTAITNPTSLTTASVNPLAAGNAGNYTITATVPGCGTATRVSTSALTVNPLPSGVTASLSASPLCVGSLLTLTGAATNAISYAWAGPAGGAAMTSTTTVNTQVTSINALNAGIYTLTATNNCGSTSAVTAALVVSQLPVFTDVVELTNPACIGGSMTLAAITSTAGAGPVVYTWSGPGGADIINSNSLTTASVNPLSAADAGVYTITATVTGCAGTSTGISSLPLVLNTQPSSVAPTASPTICAGDIINLTGNVTGGTSLTYSWTGPITGDITSASTVDASVNPATTFDAGSYTLTVTAEGCAPVVGVTAPQVVNKLPTFLLASVLPNPACAGDNVTLAGDDAGDGSGVNYSWTGPVTGDITGASSESASISPVALADAGVYTLTATAAACPGSVFEVTNILVVNALPTTLTASVSPSPACAGDNITLSGGDSGDGFGVSYSWTGPNTGDIDDPSSENTFVSNAASFDAGVYTLTVTAPGCLGSIVATSGALEVNALPFAVTADLSPSPVCAGDNVTLIGGDAGDGMGVNYSWTGPVTGNIVGASSETAVIISVSTADAGVYTLTATAPGCPGSVVAISAALSVNVLPSTVTASVSPTAVCAGSSITLSGGDSGDGLGVIFSWTGPNTADIIDPSSLNTGIVSAIVADGGIYTLTATAAGCAGSTVALTEALAVNFLPTFVTAEVSPTTACAGDNVLLNGGDSGDGAGVEFSWTGPVTADIASPASESTNISSVVSADAGVYTLTATAPGCAGSTIAVTDILVVNQLPTSITASVSPNPACVGGSVSLAGGDSGDGSGLNFSWTGPVTGDISSPLFENASITSVTNADAGVYTLTATADGCAGSVSGLSDPLVINAPIDVSDFATSSVVPIICAGASNDITVNSSSLGSGTFTVTYDLSGSNSATGNTATLIMGASSGVFTIPSTELSGSGATTVTITAIQNGIGCSAAVLSGNVATFTVSPAPSAAPTNDGYICIGGTVTLTANPASGASVFTWSGADLASTSGAVTTATPTVTTTYSLTVSDASGCTSAIVYLTTVSVNAIPVATPSNNGYICNGGTVTLSANPSGGATSFAWAGSNLVSWSGVTTTATPTATSTYTLTVSDGSGKPGCSPATPYFTTVSVNATPVAAPTNNGFICSGGTVILNSNPSGGATSFTWSGPSLVVSSGVSTVATPTLTSTYTLTVSDGSGKPGCAPATPYFTTVTVNAKPAATPNNNGYICNGGTVILNANPSGGATLFAWSGSNLSATSGATVTATPTSTSVYTLTVSDGSGHPGCAPVTQYLTIVNVNAVPTAAPTNNGYICNGGTVTLTANPANGASTFAWSGPGLISGSGATTTATPTTTGTYTLTVTDGSGKPGCSPTTPYFTTVTVNAAPAAAPTNSGYICNGGTVTLTTNESGSATTFAWTGSNITGSVSTNVTTATPTTNSVYTVAVSDGSTQPGCVVQFTTTVSVAPTPFAAPSNNGYICRGGTVTLTANEGGGATTYTWSGANISVTTSASTTATPTVTSTYTLTVTDGSGRSGCAPATQFTTTVTVNSIPAAAPINNGYICNGGTVSLNATPSGGASSYTWSGPNLSSTSIVNPTATPTATATYTLTVSDGSAQPGCSPATQYFTTVTVNPTPVAAPTNNGPVCTGGTVNLFANPSGGATVFTWTGANMSSTTIADPTATPTVTGTYTLTVSDGSGQPGCAPATEYNTTVTVNATPSLTSATSNSPICSGNTLDLVANGAANVTDYSWSGPVAITNALTANASVPSATTTASGTYTVVVNNGSGSGCSMSYTTVATVNAQPATFNVTGGGGYCSVDTGVHIGLDGSEPGFSYQLFIGSTGLGTLTGTGTALDFGLQTAVGTYTVLATNPGTLCEAAMSGSTVVSINPTPNVYELSGSGTHYCFGGSGIVMSLSGSDTGVSYQLVIGSFSTGSPETGTGSGFSFGSETTAGVYLAVATNIHTGCQSMMADSAVVIVDSLPHVYTVSGSGAYCAGGIGSNILLSGSDTGVTYVMSVGSNTVTLPGTGSALDFGLDTAQGFVSVIASNDITGCSSVMSGTLLVTVNPLPVAYSVTGGGAYCEGYSGMNVGLSGSDTGVTYSLYNGATLITTVPGTGSALNFGPQSAAGTYTVTAFRSATGCSNMMADSAVISINPAPSLFSMTGGGSYCSVDPGVSIGLNGSDTGVTYTLYDFGFPGTVVSGTGSPLDFGIHPAGTYSILATNNITGCPKAMVGTMVVTINATPTAYRVYGGGSYCEGGDGVHVFLDGSDTGIVYSLYNDGGLVGVFPGTGALLDFGLLTGAGTYTVSAVNGLSSIVSCSNDMMDSAVIVINTIVTPSVTLSTGIGDTSCEGNAVTFTANATGGGTTPAYSWTVNAGAIPGATTGSYSYVPADGDIVEVTMISSAACAVPGTVTAAYTMTVLAHETATLAIDVNPGSTVCAGTTVTITVTPAFGGAFPTYTWKKNGVTMVGVGGTSYTYVPVNGDVISVIMNSDYPCLTSDTVSASVTMHLGVSVPPLVVIIPTPGTAIHVGELDTLTAHIVIGGPVTYQWMLNHVPIPGATDSVYISTFNNNDSVTCVVVGTNGCELTDSNTVGIAVFNVGVNTVVMGEANLRLIPNPNKGEFSVSGTLGSITDAEVTMEVTDMLGQTVYKNRVIVHSGEMSEKIKLSNSLANGMYIMNISSGTEHKVFHFMVQQ